MAKRFDDWEGDFLQHFGVQGMKWGQRRYQNEDGSLTSAGRAHYGLKGKRGARSTSRALRRLEKERAGAQTRADYYHKRIAKVSSKVEKIDKSNKVRDLANKKKELEKKLGVYGDDLDGWDPKNGKKNYGIDQKQYDSIMKARSEYKKARDDYRSAYGEDYSKAGSLSKKEARFLQKGESYQKLANKSKAMSEKIIQNALSKGYSINSRDTLRFVRKGKDKVLLLLGRRGTTVNSVKYHVKDNGLGLRTHKAAVGVINRSRHRSNFL